MKTSIIVGALLIALGVAALIYKDFSYTTEETVAQFGPLKATAETEKNIPIPGALGIAAIVAGVIVIAVGSKKK
jgi:multisubunit Na+/H+ antiporter MnhC subunit